MEICQTDLPYRPWSDPGLARMPGLNPIAPGDWLQVDDAYKAQMAHRQALYAQRRPEVTRAAPGTEPALDELLALVLDELAARDDFSVGASRVRCPDGRSVTIGAPLPTLNQLVQEDFCLLQKPVGADEHLLTAALLCFPASWSLEEKFQRPLAQIHGPVASYDANMARRVQRLFDHIHPDGPMWRANALIYDDPELFQPRSTQDRRPAPRKRACWLRSERQSLLRLKATDAVVFSIHTYVVACSRFSPEERAAFGASGASRS